MNRVFIPSENRNVLLISFTLASLLAMVKFSVIPLLPIDETRYIGVAWEMFTQHHWLIPTMNGHLYSEKPPLLFWLILAGWHAFGISDWLPRLIILSFDLGSMALVHQLARRLWPAQPKIARDGVLMLMGMSYWLNYLPRLMFDMLVVFFTLWSLLAVLLVAQHQRGYVQLALSTGLGLLAKGPVIFIFTLPAMLSGYWLVDKPYRLNPRRLSISLLGGCCMALAWAIPAAWYGGGEFANKILIWQSTHRLLSSHHHYAIWHYFPIFGELLLLLILWPTLWSAWQQLAVAKRDFATRWLGWSLLLSFFLLNLIQVKAYRYLLPLLPLTALLSARALATSQPRYLGYSQWLFATLFTLMACLWWLFMWDPLAFAFIRLLNPEHAPWLYHLPWYGGLVLCMLAGLWLRADTQEAQLWSIVASNVLIAFLLLLAVEQPSVAYYDVSPLARRVALYQAKQLPIASLGRYENQLHYYGRLTTPLRELTLAEAQVWQHHHPAGLLLKHCRLNQLPPMANRYALQNYWGMHRVPAAYVLFKTG